MTSGDINSELRDLVLRYGKNRIEEALEQVTHPESLLVCTIIADNTVHKIPNELVEGDVFVFFEGNFNVDDTVDISDQIEFYTKRLIDFLRSSSYKKYNLIYSGHAVLASTIKYCVYRVAHIETVDIIYFGSSGYRKIKPYINNLVRRRPKT